MKKQVLCEPFTTRMIWIIAFLLMTLPNGNVLAQNYQGTWNGKTDQNEFIYFNVNADNEIDTIAIRLKILVKTYNMGKWDNNYCTTNFGNSLHVAILNNSFNIAVKNSKVYYKGGSEIRVNGTFTSPTECTGKVDTSNITGFSCSGWVVFNSAGNIQTEQTWVTAKSVTTHVIDRESNNYLLENYPNPFSSQTIISFMLPESSLVMLKIIDSCGKEIVELARSHFESGFHNITWDAKGIPGGIYLCRMQTQDYSKTIKLVLKE